MNVKDTHAITNMIHHGEFPENFNGAIVQPLFQNSTFTFSSWEDIDNAFSEPSKSYIYTRGNNPSSTMVEEKIALLANGECAKLFSSGMAAMSSAIMHSVCYGDHIVAVANVYGPTSTFISDYLRRKSNISVTFVKGTDITEFEKAIQYNTKLFVLESPSSVVFSLQDLKAIADIAHAHNIKTICDNSWATPIFQKTLSLGIDLEVHSISKYIAGHSDVLCGVIIGKEKDIHTILLEEYALFGACISPHEAWLVNRSLKTLHMRMAQHQQSAIKIARHLEDTPHVKQVHFPGLLSHPQYELGREEMTGYSGLFSFSLHSDDLDKIKTFVNSLRLFHIAVSWGGCESLVYAPAISYVKELTPDQFKMMWISLGNIRLSIGLEDVDDLIADLDAAMNIFE